MKLSPAVFCPRFKNQHILYLAMILCGTFHAGAATYYVDYDAGSDSQSGLEQGKAWKHSPGDPQAKGAAAAAGLNPGDVVHFRAGVAYRGNVVVPASGSEKLPIVFKGRGWGEGRAILDGAEPIQGWRKCSTPAEALGNPNFANLFYVEMEMASPFALNLHEQAPGGEDEFLWMSQEPNPADPFFHDRTDSFHRVTSENLTTSTIVAPEVFTSQDPNFYDGASVLVWMSPNWTKRYEIQSYDPGSRRITFSPFPKSGLWSDKRDQFFAIYNSPSAIDLPGEYAVGKPDASGKRRLLLWPRSSADLDGRISFSVRKQGFSLGGQSHITIEGFSIKKFGGETEEDGCGIASSPPGEASTQGYIIRDNRISHIFSGERGYGAIYLDKTSGALIENNEIEWTNSHRSIFVTDSENVIIRNNLVSYAGRTSVVMYTCKRSQIINNRISHVFGTHANALTLYLACENILVAGNHISNATTPITFQDSGPLYFFNNIIDGDWKYKNVSEWPNTKRGPWSVGRIVFLNNTIVNADKHCALNIGIDPEKTYIVINNILDGLALKTGKDSVSSVLHSHNIFTGLANSQHSRYGWAMGEDESLVDDLNGLFVNPEAGDFRLKPGGPTIGAGMAVEQYYPKDVFPEVDFSAISGATKPMNIGATLPAK
jgi:parallel beta-helix repeat protein